MIDLNKLLEELRAKGKLKEKGKEPMFNLNMTEEDLKRGIIVDENGWYLLEFIDGFEEINKKQDGKNLVCDFKILQSESGDEKYSGVPVRYWLSDKAPSRARGFLAAMGYEVKAGQYGIDHERLKGKRVLGYLKKRLVDDTMMNGIEDFRAV